MLPMARFSLLLADPHATGNPLPGVSRAHEPDSAPARHWGRALRSGMGPLGVGRVGTMLLLAALVGGVWPATTALAEDTPAMDPRQPIDCVDMGKGKQIRLQCSRRGDLCTCLTASPYIKDDEGKDTSKMMEQLRYCNQSFPANHLEQLKLAGCRMVPALADSPEGHMRDSTGQLYQVTFDMRRRFYLGSAWNPVADKHNSLMDRIGFNYGFRVYDLSYSKRERDNFRFLEGTVSLEPLDFSFLLFEYDQNVNADEPVFWITTFIGPPTRFDITSDMGWGIRLLKMDFHPMQGKSIDIENIALYLSWDVAHNTTMANYLRFAAGLAFGELVNTVPAAGEKKETTDTRVWLDPLVMLTGEFQLDEDGLHHLGLSASGTTRVFFDDFSEIHYTAGATLSYEWVMLAINDQPISLYLEASGMYREDLRDLTGVADDDLPPLWEGRFMVGGRFSFWAPSLPTYQDNQ